MSAPPPGDWWVEPYVEFASAIEGESVYTPRGGAYTDYSGSLWRFVNERVPEALRTGLTTRDACDRWYSGAYLIETVPGVLYICARHADAPEEAIVRAVNDTRDSDTVAAMGALHGEAQMPQRWREGLTGRTCPSDDGHVQALLDAARQRWG